MPKKLKTRFKLKTHRGAAKRFALNKGGKGSQLRFRRAFRNHILTKKSNTTKRQRRKQGSISLSDRLAVFRLLRIK